MINLIPNEEKKKKVRDFYVRMVTTCFVVLAISILIASAGMLPAYFLSSVKLTLVNTKLDLQKKDAIPSYDKKNLAVVGDLNTKLGLIEKSKAAQYIVSEKIINEIMRNKMSDIKITGLIYLSDPKVKGVTITGTAASRDRLLVFKKALEDNPAFKKVDLPISNLVKGSDIEFNLTLVPA